jgi:signal transduction histidine kinase/CheY-like chemotaxis protein
MPRDSRALLGIVHPDDRGQVAAAVMRSVIDREQFSIELRIEARKGEWRWIASRGHAYYGQDLRATRLVGVVNRIDDRLQAEEERRQLESRVQQAQKLETLATLAGGVAHDFNNLLQAINSNVELARSVMRPNEEIDAYLTQIEAASDRAGELTDQLLSYAGRRRIAWESIDLSRLTLEMSQLLEASIAKRARLLGQFAANLPPVLGDPTQLRQILLNLIVNAAESLPGGGSEIRLKTGTTHLDRQQLARIQASVELFEGNYVFLEVADTGCGMPPEVQSRIFDPFFTTKATGRGLGLAAVLGITCSHAGGVGVESAPGEGTTIRIYLPPAPGHLQAPAATHAREAEPAVPDVIEKTVLVVDDDAFVLESARLLLESIGFATISARSGREALEIFDSQQQTIHVVLLDLTMPGVSGDAVLRELRKRAPELPIVLCSGFSEEDAGRLPIHDGISLFLQKPFRSSELRQKLHAVLEAAGGLERHSPPAE